jgi:hypothetical protein
MDGVWMVYGWCMDGGWWIVDGGFLCPSSGN